MIETRMCRLEKNSDLFAATLGTKRGAELERMSEPEKHDDPFAAVLTGLAARGKGRAVSPLGGMRHRPRKGVERPARSGPRA